MAEKRMFASQVLTSDAFLDLPFSAQCLYVQLNLKADDDGFVSNPKSIARQCGTSEVDLELLKSRRFLLGFDTGVVCVKHWRINNTLRWDRYTPTAYQAEARTLFIKENGSYTLNGGSLYPTHKPYGNHVATTRQPKDYQVATQYRLDEIRLDEKSIEESKKTEDVARKPRTFTPPSLEEVHMYCFANHYFIDPTRFIDYYESNGWRVGKTKMVSWKGALSGWAKREMERNPTQQTWTDIQLDYLIDHPEIGSEELR